MSRDGPESNISPTFVWGCNYKEIHPAVVFPYLSGNLKVAITKLPLDLK